MILPIIFVAIISITDQNSITENGYSFFPKAWSIDAYTYIFKNAPNILASFGVSTFITIIGTILGTFLIATYAYALSRRTFRYRKFFTIVALIPMLFSAGIVASYLVMTRFLGLKDSLLALIFPLAMNSFFMFILKIYFQNFIPESLLDSAKIDGGNELQIFFHIVVPIAKPGIATIALFLTLGYWNDWFHAMLYIDSPNKIPIQYLLIKIENTTSFLQQMGSQLGSNIAEITASIPTNTIRMAIVVIIVLPIALAYPYFQKYFVKGLTMGSVKE